MPGFPAPFIKFREDDANGFPLAGGKLYSYAAGTSTPLATYTTQALNVANLNPTILDASGRANVFIQDGVGYKFVLNDTLGNLVWSVDNVQVPQIQAAAAAQEMPTGGIALYGGTAAPASWLMCDGAPVSRSGNAALFAVIGTTFGAGNGSTTFNTPDLRGRFPIGKAVSGTGASLGSSGGLIDHTHTGPSHTHTIASHVHTIAHTHTVSRIWTPGSDGGLPSFPEHLLTSGGGGGGGHTPDNDQTTSASSVANSGGIALTTDAGGTGATSTANPPFLSVNYIIKT